MMRSVPASLMRLSVLDILSYHIVRLAAYHTLGPHPEEAAKRPNRRMAIGAMVRDARLRCAPHHEVRRRSMRSNTGLDFDLGETADLLRASVRAFAADRIAP